MNYQKLKKKLINKLACPICHTYFKKTSLKCSKCKKEWKVKNDVYEFLDPNNIVAKQELIGVKKLDFQNEIDPKNSDLNKYLIKLPNIESNPPDKLKGYLEGVSRGKEIFEKVKDIIGKNKYILEVGADWGWASHQLAKNGNMVIACDINNIHLKNADYFTKGDGSYFLKVQSDMNNLPIKSKSMDYILGIASVHHSSDIKKSIREFHRILKPNGKLILLREPVNGKYHKNTSFAENEIEIGIHETVPNLQDWEKAILDSGFKYEKEVSRLNFTKSGNMFVAILKTIKRIILSIPIIGNFLANFTITDYNFWARK